MEDETFETLTVKDIVVIWIYKNNWEWDDDDDDEEEEERKREGNSLTLDTKEKPDDYKVFSSSSSSYLPWALLSLGLKVNRCSILTSW